MELLLEITGKNFIGNAATASGDKVSHAFNPTTGEQLPGAFVSATESEVNATMELAQKAYSEYKLVSGAKKAEFLEAIASEIEGIGEPLVERATSESGLPAGRIQGETGRTVGQLRAFANLIKEGSWLEASVDTADPNRQPFPKPDIRKMLMATGPVVVFAASNFPLAFSTAGGDTASALAGGNPVIVKAHSGHLGTSELIAGAILRAAEKTGMPNGVFSLLHGGGATVGQALVKHPITKAVGFTGSTYAGRVLFDIANQRPEPIPVFAEMGSINPVLLLQGALEVRGTQIAQQYAGSVTMGVGQFCTNPGLIIAKKSAATDNFIVELGKAIQEIAPATMLNERVHSAYVKDRAETLAQSGVSNVANSNEEDAAAAKQGRPTVAKASGKDFLANPKLHEEVFGPFTLVIEVENDAEVTAVIAKLAGQLTATVMGEDSELEENQEVITLLKERTGRLIYNGVPTGVEVNASMVHGGPYPASTDGRFTSVGMSAIKRFVRPISLQGWPDATLPAELQNSNPLNIWRLVNNNFTKDSI